MIRLLKQVELTQGVRIINLKGDQSVSTVAVVPAEKILEIEIDPNLEVITQQAIDVNSKVNEATNLDVVKKDQEVVTKDELFED